MNKKQEKSPCCQGKVWRYAERRRQCSICKKTWRLWQKKKGSKKKRFSFEVLFRYLKNDKESNRFQAQKIGISTAALHFRISKLAQAFNKKTSWPEIPEGELIAVADAMIEYIERIPHAIYFFLIRSVNLNKAVITPFFVTVGAGEKYLGWDGALNQIPSDIRSRIRVLVCDGVNALSGIAKREGWILQRCHFHILARFVINGSLGSLGHNPERARYLQKLVKNVLYTKDTCKLNESLQEIIEIRKTITSKTFRSVLLGFTKHYQDFRSYLSYPEYSIPITSNSAEHLIGRIRNLQYRAKGFRTLKSLKIWIEALCKFTKYITCNGTRP